MDKLSEEKEIIKIEKKLLKNFEDSFVTEIRGMTPTQLEERIVAFTKAAQENITAKKEDEALEQARKVVNSLNAPYSEFQRKNSEKMRFISLVLQEKTE